MWLLHWQVDSLPLSHLRSSALATGYTEFPGWEARVCRLSPQPLICSLYQLRLLGTLLASEGRSPGCGVPRLPPHLAQKHEMISGHSQVLRLASPASLHSCIPGGVSASTPGFLAEGGLCWQWGVNYSAEAPPNSHSYFPKEFMRVPTEYLDPWILPQHITISRLNSVKGTKTL